MAGTNPRNSDASKAESLRRSMAYDVMALDISGSILTRAEKMEIRLRHGYCKECPGEPIQLFTIRKSKLNPLWVTKEPRAVLGECAGGVCFVCHPDQNPHLGRFHYQPKGPSGGRGSDSSGSGSAFPQSTNCQEAGHAGDASTSSLTSGTLGTNTISSHSSNGRQIIAGQDPLPVRTAVAPPVSPGTISTLSTQLEIRNEDANEHARSLDSTTTNLKKETPQWSRVCVSEPMKESSGEIDESQAVVSMQDFTSALEITHVAIGASDHNRPFSESNGGNQPTGNNDTSSSQVDTSGQSRSESHPSTSESDTTPPFLNPRPMPSLAEDISQPSFPDRTDTRVSSLPDVASIVEEIDELVRDATASGSSEFLVAVLLGAMRGHVQRSSIQAHCLGAMGDLCKENESHRCAVVAAGGEDDIIRCMRNHPDVVEVQERACFAVWSLCGDSSTRITFVLAGVCKELLYALQRHIANESPVRRAISAMRMLSPEAEARDAFQSITASKCVAEAMVVHSCCHYIQRDGCAFLSNVAVNLQQQFVTVVPKEELDAVVQAIANHRHVDSVRKGACFALTNYTHEEANCRTLRKCAGVDELISFAAQLESDQGCAGDATSILERLEMSLILDQSLEDEACASLRGVVECQMGTTHAVANIVEYMRNFEWSARVNECCIELCQTMIASMSNESVDAIFAEDTLSQILRYASSFDDEKLMRKACDFLPAIAASSSFANNDLLTLQASQLVFACLNRSRSNEGLALSALQALLHLMPAREVYRELMDNIGLVTEVVSEHASSDEIQSIGGTIFSSLDRPPS